MNALVGVSSEVPTKNFKSRRGICLNDHPPEDAVRLRAIDEKDRTKNSATASIIVILRTAVASKASLRCTHGI